METSVAEAKQKPTVAPSVFNHYWQRFTWFALDALILGVFWMILIAFVGFIHCVSGYFNQWQYFHFEISIPVVLAAFVLKFVRTRLDFARTGMFVVDNCGVRVSWTRSAVRTLAYFFTWFLLPLHLVFIAVGSRRLLHDYIAGTFVINEGEDLKTSFYPPARSWLAPLLVVGCVALVCMSGQVSQMLLRTELELVPIVLGSDSKNYLTYLKMRFHQKPQHLEYLTEEEAKPFKIQYYCMHALQHQYYGDKSKESVRILYCAALVAAASKDREHTDALVHQILTADPDIFAKVVQGSYDYGMQQFATQNMAAAYLYSKAGQPSEASMYAEMEKQSAEKAGSVTKYTECCEVLEREYSALYRSIKGPQAENHKALAEQQRRDVKRFEATKI